jgi:DNA replication licensing factor MCM7
LIYQRSRRDQANQSEDVPESFPPMLTRRYSLSFKPRSALKQLSVRDIRGSHVGKMVKIRGMVTRVSNVKPLAVVVAYSCDKCGSEIFQDVRSESFTPLSSCPSQICKINNVKGMLHLQTRGCKFVKFQEMKLQELVTIILI